MSIPYLNDGSSHPPRLSVFLNTGTLRDLPEWATAPRGSEEEVLAAVKAAGFEGIQGGDPGLCAKLGLPSASEARLNTVSDAEAFDAEIKGFKDEGRIAVTVHAGWGWEDDATCDALADILLQTSAKHDMPIYLESHRATITQDSFRTVQLLARKPGLMMNSDYSHWYTGLEMVYGDLDAKFDFLQPAFERAGFMHGRIGNPGNMQIGLGADYEEAVAIPSVQHFMEMWKRTFRGFLKNAGPGDYLPLAVELLEPKIFYARVFPDAAGELREQSDRWNDALIMAQIAREAFKLAQA